MSDNTEPVVAEEPQDAPEASVPAEHEGEVISPPVPEVVAQEAKIVGDDELEVFTVEPEVVEEQVAAQVAQPREADRDSVDVHETSVMLDEVITDPSDPRAVIIPDAGRGSLDLPIHRLALGLPKFD
jgi:hypothetical protein